MPQNRKFLDIDGLDYFFSKLKAIFIRGVKVNNSALTPDINGVVNVSVPTNTSDLNNDSDFVASTSLGAVATSNDYTDLDNLPTIPAAQVNSDWNSTSGVSKILNKPTNVSAFTNDSGYQNASQVTSAINSAIAGITGIEFEVVQTLPTTGRTGTIYLVSNGGAAPNTYDEYIYYNSSWEKIGSTAVDLSHYWNDTNLVPITNAEIDTICT